MNTKIYTFLVKTSRGINYISGGGYDNTFSARTGKNVIHGVEPKWFWRNVERFVDTLLYTASYVLSNKREIHHCTICHVDTLLKQNDTRHKRDTEDDTGTGQPR